MSRLTEKLKQASGVVGRQTARIEARADAIIAREPQIEAQTDQAFSLHDAMLNEAEKGLDALARELALVSNAPLGGYGASSDAEPGPFVPLQGVQTPKPATTERVALGPHPDQPEKTPGELFKEQVAQTKLELDAKAADLDPHVYRKFEAGMPLLTAKAVNGS